MCRCLPNATSPAARIFAGPTRPTLSAPEEDVCGLCLFQHITTQANQVITNNNTIPFKKNKREITQIVFTNSYAGERLINASDTRLNYKHVGLDVCTALAQSGVMGGSDHCR